MNNLLTNNMEKEKRIKLIVGFYLLVYSLMVWLIKVLIESYIENYLITAIIIILWVAVGYCLVSIINEEYKDGR